MHAARRRKLKKASVLFTLVDEALKEPLTPSCLICMRFKQVDEWAYVSCSPLFEIETPIGSITRDPKAFAKDCQKRAAACSKYNPEDFLSIKRFSKGVRIT